MSSLVQVIKLSLVVVEFVVQYSCSRPFTFANFVSGRPLLCTGPLKITLEHILQFAILLVLVGLWRASASPKKLKKTEAASHASPAAVANTK